MLDGKKNRYGRTAARQHRTLGRARRPATTTIDIHCHIVVAAGAQVAGPHVDPTKVPLAYFANSATKEINALQEEDRAKVMVDVDSRLFDMDAMGIDIQVVAPAPPQCYYSVSAEIGERAHRAINEGVAEFASRRPDRFVGLGVTTMQAPDLAVSELETAVTKLGLKGVQILTSVNGGELSDPKYGPFFAKAEELKAFIMLHPNGFTEGRRFTDYYFNNVVGNPGDDARAASADLFWNSGALPGTQDTGGAWWRLFARVFRAHRPRLGRARRQPCRPFFTAVYLFAPGLFRYGCLHGTPARLLTRRIRARPNPAGYGLSVRYGRV